MAWTNTNPVTSVGLATKKSHYDDVFDNSKFLRDSVGDFTYLILGTGLSGTVSAPLITWRDDSDSGIYRIGANNLGITCGGSKILDILTTGLSVVGSISATGGLSGTTLSLSGAITGATSIACTSITGLSGLAVGGALTTVTSIACTSITGLSGLAVGGALTTVTSIACTSISNTGTLAVGNGTLGAPGIFFGSDSDTGLFHSVSDNIFSAVAGGINVLYVTSTFLGVLFASGDDGTGAKLQMGGLLSMPTVTDSTGVAGRFALTSICNDDANSTGNGAIKMKGTTSRESAGFWAIKDGTTVKYVPYFTTITG